MSITKLIKKLALPYLKQYRFEYKGVEAGIRWIFERKEGDVTQIIRFEKSSIVQGLRVEFQTSNRQGKPAVGGNVFMNDKNYWFEYYDMESLEEIIKSLCNAVVSNMNIFNFLSIPDFEPTLDMYKSLIQNPKEKSKSFVNKYFINFDNANQSLITLMNVCKEESSKNSNNVDMIVNLAAFLGELIIYQIGGSWMWEEEIKLTYIGDIGGVGLEVSPLDWITNYWGNPNLIINNLSFRYEGLEKSYSNRL